ncbi:MAG TPA: iron-sulfur cluster assembly scaffold protein [Rhodoglobus sp.]|nr:iron-sulfur cluster assembly scaffold protein [Rhodoglobus sp.]
MRQLVIEDLHRARHGHGLAADFDGEGSEFSPSCGDAVTVRLSGESFTWEGNGCTVSMAAASALGTFTLADFERLREAYLASVLPDGEPVEGDLAAFAGIGRFPLRARCATLAWRAAETAVSGGAASGSP